MVKDVEFYHRELSEKVQAVHISVYPLTTISALSNHWISPLSSDPQEKSHPGIIFDFLLIRVNVSTTSKVPEEAMRF